MNHRSVPAPAWLVEAQQHWLVMAKAGCFGGWIHANLDEFLDDDARTAEAVRLCEDALERLTRLGPVLKHDWINSLGIGAGECFREDVKTTAFMEIGRAFVDLLKGHIRTGPNSPVLPKGPWRASDNSS